MMVMRLEDMVGSFGKLGFSRAGVRGMEILALFRLPGQPWMLEIGRRQGPGPQTHIAV
jgi:hypothetical protein